MLEAAAAAATISFHLEQIDTRHEHYCSPDGDCRNGDLSVLQVADDDDEEHVEPELEADQTDNILLISQHSNN